MKIISQFKDYYDYVQHAYGGGDPKIVYERRRFGKRVDATSTSYTERVEVFVDEIVPLHVGFAHVDRPTCGRMDYSMDWGFSWLIVCGKPFPLIDTGAQSQIRHQLFDEVKHADLIVEKKHFWMPDPTHVGEEIPRLVEYSKLVGQPVFVIERFHRHMVTRKKSVVVCGEVPRLGDLGLASVYPAEQLYQDLSYFIVNKMKDSPDTMPPTVMSDKEKIVASGFDLKKSFRHRKNNE